MDHSVSIGLVRIEHRLCDLPGCVAGSLNRRRLALDQALAEQRWYSLGSDTEIRCGLLDVELLLLGLLAGCHWKPPLVVWYTGSCTLTKIAPHLSV